MCSREHKKAVFVESSICAPGSSNIVCLCCRELKYCFVEPPGAQILFAYAPGGSSTACLSSRELKYCLLVPPGARILIACATGSKNTVFLNPRELKCCFRVLSAAHGLIPRAPGSSSTDFVCSREHKYGFLELSGAQILLPGAQVQLACAPGSSGTACLCSREHKYCFLDLLGAQILIACAPRSTGQRLLETEVFRQINKSKGNGNVFEDPQSLFRFREDEKAGPVLNTRHVWNCRARPPVVVAADLVHKAISLHLSVAAVPPDETWPDWMAFLQVAEELQMVDISLLFRRAEVAFFLNLHNALMLHTHMHRGTSTGEALRSIKVGVCLCV